MTTIGFGLVEGNVGLFEHICDAVLMVSGHGSNTNTNGDMGSGIGVYKTI